MNKNKTSDLCKHFSIVFFPIIVVSIVLSNFFEPVWLGRWIGIFSAVSTIIFCLWFFVLMVAYRGVVRKENWFKIMTKKEHHTKTEKSILTVLLLSAPFLALFSTIIVYVPLLKDTTISVFQGDNSIEKQVTVWKTGGCPGGACFLYRYVETEGGEIFSLPLSFEGFGRRTEYVIRYLPYSKDILDYQEVKRTEDEVIIITEMANLPSKAMVSEFEEALQNVLWKSSIGYLEQSIQPVFDAEHFWEIDRAITTTSGFKSAKSSLLSIKGDDAEKIYQAILPVLKQYPFLKGSKIEIRYKDRSREDKFGFSAITLE